MDRITLSDFSVEKSSTPFRCIRCGHMQRAGADLIYLADGADWTDKFKDGETAESLLIGSRSWYRSGWCAPCVQRVLDRQPRPLVSWLRNVWAKVWRERNG